MKKLLIALLAVILVFSFAACSNNQNVAESPAAQEPAPADEPAEPAVAEVPAEEPEQAADESWTMVEDKGSVIRGVYAG